MNIQKIVVVGVVMLGVGSVLPTLAEAATASSTVTISTYDTSRVVVEQRVREYFKGVPAMIEIARCESEFRQYTETGTVLRGGWGKNMIGVFQFYEPVHAATAATMGLDLKTLEGNLAYAKYVYESQGTTPWNASRACWDVPRTSVVTGKSVEQQRSEKIALLTKLLALLQQQLAAQRALQS